MTIDYDTLTTETIDEYAEFINWSLVPSHLITDEVKKNFEFFPTLRARVWFDDILHKMVIKKDQKRYPNKIFFFVDDEYFMDFDFECNTIWCSYQNFWSIFNAKSNIKDDSEISNIIKNLVEQHFKTSIIKYTRPSSLFKKDFEIHFESKGIISIEESGFISL